MTARARASYDAAVRAGREAIDGEVRRLVSELPRSLRPAIALATEGVRRFRPLLLLMACEQLGGRVADALPFA